MSEWGFASVLAAFVGDSLGSLVEFQNIVTDDEVKKALKMPGGGPHDVGPGQITDDSELAICLGRGLLEGGMDTVAKNYIKWIKSDPFDAGHTCFKAFSIDASNDQASIMTKNARKFNMDSKANGSLMRLTPAIIYGHNFLQCKFVKLMKADAMLSHPNQTVQDCNVCYGLAIRHLFTNHGDNEGAYKVAIEWAQKNAVDEVVLWLKESTSHNKIKCTDQQGFVRWAFMLSFYHLHKKTSFVDAIVDTIKRAGDTDTNAAIVAGMVAAVHGIDGIPQYMKDKVLNYNYKEHGGQKRPAWLSASQLKKLCSSLWKMGEKENSVF